MSWVAWTTRELDTLRNVYPKAGLVACMERLPDRSAEAIRVRASSMKLRHPSTWTAGDDAVLRLLYPEGGPIPVHEMLPWRPVSAIYRRARRLGLYRVNATAGRWPGDKVPYET